MFRFVSGPRACADAGQRGVAIVIAVAFGAIEPRPLLARPLPAAGDCGGEACVAVGDQHVVIRFGSVLAVGPGVAFQTIDGLMGRVAELGMLVPNLRQIGRLDLRQANRRIFVRPDRHKRLFMAFGADARDMRRGPSHFFID